MVDAEYKLSKNVKIAMLFLEDEDPVNAELYIKKASSLLTSTKAGSVRLLPASLRGMPLTVTQAACMHKVQVRANSAQRAALLMHQEGPRQS